MLVIEEFELMTDSISKFHKYVYIHGWSHSVNDKLASIQVDGIDAVHIDSSVEIDHGGVLHAVGPKKGFEVSILRGSDCKIPESAYLVFNTQMDNRYASTLLIWQNIGYLVIKHSFFTMSFDQKYLICQLQIY